MSLKSAQLDQYFSNPSTFAVNPLEEADIYNVRSKTVRLSFRCDAIANSCL